MITTIKKDEIDKYIGFEPEPTAWFTVTQEQIDEFAECTHDQQYIHVDPEKAKDTPFGTTIAHGFLSLSMLSHFAAEFSVIIDGYYMGVNYGFDKVRFVAPVKVSANVPAGLLFAPYHFATVNVQKLMTGVQNRVAVKAAKA